MGGGVGISNHITESCHYEDDSNVFVLGPSIPNQDLSSTWSEVCLCLCFVLRFMDRKGQADFRNL